jgi:hypothetical protein
LNAFDVDKDLLATLRGFDEPEAAFVVPCLERALEAHGSSVDDG